jgi:hypothetical protein
VKQNRLNQKASGLLNNYIRAAAHLEGTTDYEGWYKDNIQKIVPTQYLADKETAAQLNAALPQPKAGDVINGFQFLGGDSTQRDNWLHRDTGKGIAETFIDAPAVQNLVPRDVGEFIGQGVFNAVEAVKGAVDDADRALIRRSFNFWKDRGTPLHQIPLNVLQPYLETLEASEESVEVRAAIDKKFGR